MKLSSFILVIMFLLVALMAAIAIDASATTVMLVGDSITLGFVGGPEAIYEPELSFGGLLVDSLGPEYIVYNKACAGSATYQWTPFAAPSICLDFNGTSPDLNYFNAKIISTGIAVVMLGTNDIGYAVPPTEYDENIRSLMAGLFNEGVVKIILVSPPPRPEVGTIGSPAITAVLNQYKDVLANICDTTSNVSCVDILTALTPGVQDYFYYGGEAGADVHPNYEGHAAIHELVHNHIIALPEPSSIVLLTSGLIGLFVLSRKPR